MAVRCRKGRWIVYYRDPENPSKQKEESFGSGPGAEAAARRRNIELGFGYWKRMDLEGPAGPTFHEISEAYVNEKSWLPNSRRMIEIRLDANILPFFGHIPASSIDHKILSDYIKHRRSAPIYSSTKVKESGKRRILRIGVKQNTINRELSDIIAILNWAADRKPELIPKNPVGRFKKPMSDDAVIDPPTLEETIKIINEASDHVRRAIFLSFYLGLRPGAVELLSLRWDHVNLEKRYIRIISAKKGGPVSRMVPIIHESFYDLLKIWKDSDQGSGPIIHYNGKSIKSFWRGFKTAVKRAGIIRRIRPYDLRHHFASVLLGQGEDIKTVAELMGSSPATILKHYRHVTKQQHRTTVSKIPDIGKAIQDNHTKHHTSNVVSIISHRNNK